MIDKNMSCKDIMIEIAKRKLKGIMIHVDMTDIFNLMNLHGLKRKHEFQHLKENAELMSLKRWITERYKIIPNLKDVHADVNPLGIKDKGTRDNISRDNKMKVIKELLKTIIDWEIETLEILEKAYLILIEKESIADSIKVSKLISDVDKELKYYQRDWIKYDDIGWDLTLVTYDQNELHDKYKDKSEKIYKLEFN